MSDKIAVEVNMKNGVEPQYYYFDSVIEAERKMKVHLGKLHKSEVSSIEVYVVEGGILKNRLGSMNMLGKFMCI